MPEGITPYPRWHGPMAPGERWTTVAAHEMRMAWRGTWSFLALVLALAWGIISIAEAYQFRSEGVTQHELDWFLDMLHQLRWFALAAAAVIGGQALTEDARRGALELYMTRSLSHRGYLLGKAAALLSLTTLTLFLPAVLYYAGVFVFFDEHPVRWGWALPGALAYSIQWGLLISGMALGLSAVSRSSRAATLILLGLFAGLEIVVGDLLAGLTEEPALAVLSPFDAVRQNVVYWFQVDAPFAFPAWWGTGAWAVLTLLGWGMMVWRHPRVRGEEA